MNELEALYGPLGLGAITLALPYILQVLKHLTGWEDRAMLAASIVLTYFLVDLYYVAIVLQTASEVSVSSVLFVVLGMIIYPLLVWFGTQGIYVKMIQK